MGEFYTYFFRFFFKIKSSHIRALHPLPEGNTPKNFKKTLTQKFLYPSIWGLLPACINIKTNSLSKEGK